MDINPVAPSASVETSHLLLAASNSLTTKALATRNPGTFRAALALVITAFQQSEGHSLPPSAYHHFSRLLLEQCRNTKSSYFLVEAIALLKAPAAAPLPPALERSLSDSYTTLSHIRGAKAPELLFLAIDHGYLALGCTAPEHPGYRVQLRTLALLHHHRWNWYAGTAVGEEVDTEQDLNLAIKVAETALKLKKKPGKSRREVLEAIRVHTGKGVAGRPVIIDEGEKEEDEEEEEGEKVEEEVEDGDPLCDILRMELAIYHSQRYDLRRSPTDLNTGITYAEEALADDNKSTAAMARHVLRNLLKHRYPLSKDLNDLTAAIEVITFMKDSLPSSDLAIITACQWDLSRFHRERYTRLGCEDDLHTALEYATALATTDPLGGVPCIRDKLLLHTAWLLGMRFELESGRGDIDTAIEKCKGGLELLSKRTGEGYRKGHLLRELLNLRFHRFGDIADLDTAIHDAEAELSRLVPGSDEHRLVQVELRNYEYQKRNRWGPPGRDQLQAGEDDYGQLQQETADSIGCRHPVLLGGLAARFFVHWENTHGPEALHMAVKLSRSAVEASEDEAEEEKGGGGHKYAMVLGTLGLYLEEQSKHLNSFINLEEAIELSARQMSLTPNDPYTLLGLATKLIARYDHTREVWDLDAAIATCTLADARAPAPHIIRPSVFVEVSRAWKKRYLQTDDSANLESAITAAEKALDLTPPSELFHAGLIARLGSLIGCRYDDTNALSDLELSMELLKAAVEACPPDHPLSAELHVTQGINYGKLYNRFQKLDDLKVAEELIEKALAQMQPGHHLRPRALLHLGVMHFRMHEETDDSAHLVKAMELNALCREILPPGHPMYRNLYLTLARARLALYKDHTHDDGDLALATESAEMAAAASEPPSRADAQHTLGACLAAAGTTEGYFRAVQAYMQGWKSVLSTPRTRMYCASETARLYVALDKWEEASEMADEAVMLLPRTNPRSLERRDQQRVLGNEAGIGAIAATVALRAGRSAGHALRMLEFGRGVMLGYIIDNRSDISNLRRGRPELADKFEELRRALDSSAKEEAEQEETPIAATGRRVHYYGIPRQRKLLSDIDQLLGEIRGIEGYEGFLLPPGEQEMMKLAESGPVVVVIPLVVSYAIIITTAEIKAIRLPKMDGKGLFSVAFHLVEMWELVEGPIRTYDARNKRMGVILLWLWDAVVEPILGELQIHAPSPEVESNAALLPHIWWIGVGLLGAMPFHAAGDHSPGSNKNTISRVVSSYIPTLKALAYARERAPTATSPTDNERDKKKKLDSQHSLLLVTMDTTPGEGQLKKVTKEAENLKAIVEAAGAKATVLPQPSASRVLNELQRYDVVHFACHGVTDSADPSKSALLLLSEDGQSVSRLLVEKVAAINSLRARLAYLSACKTADSGKGVSLGDESIHLAGAFQLAGFAHVVATMWTGSDRACMEVAEDFYKGLYCVGGHGNVGREVHAAVRRLREKKPGKYLQWAPFIHTGP